MKLAIAEAIGTSFYAGYMPKAPGTAGAAVGVLVVYLLHRFAYFNSYDLGWFVLVALVPCIWASNVLIEALNSKDPQCIVADEVLGQMVSFIGVDLSKPLSYLVAFGLFRAFDIWKPYPVNLFERLPGGYGVMMDDLMAGIYAAGVMYLLRHFLNLPL